MLQKIQILIVMLLLPVVLFSCGEDADEEIKDAILEAKIYLTSLHCDEAIEVLNEVGMQNNHAKYLQTLSSAYACKAGFSEPVLFATDLPKFTAASLFGGLATFSTSELMTEADDYNFSNLQTAIDILLYAGGIPSTTEPTATQRADRFTSGNDAGDINAQLMYMILAQIGMYSYYYGNTDANGAKGAGTAFPDNHCFLKYADNNGDIDVFLTDVANPGGACDGIARDGHLDLGTAGNMNIRRACYGVVLLNNLLDVIVGVTASIGDDEFDAVPTAALTAAKALLQAAIIAAGEDAYVIDSQSQTNCESRHETDQDPIEYYFAWMYEVLLQ